MGYKINKGFIRVREPNIPAEYQEVEYIESTGSGTSGQHIDTGYFPSSNTKVEFSMGGWNQAAGSFQIFGEDTNRTSGDKGFSIVADNYSFNGPNSSTFTHGFRDGSDHTGVLDNTGLYRDGVLVHNGRAGQVFTAASYSMAIFCLHRTNTYVEHSSYKLYSLKIYESGTLMMDFVPCYRKSDNIIGLYDKVNNQFYTNAGTGTFTKGNDVAPTYEFKEKQFYPGAGKGGALFEIETDFRNYSNISDVYALGWGAQAKGSMQPAVNSTYGFYCGNYTSYRGGQWLYYDISSYMANAKKIYAHLTGYMPGGYTYQANERIMLCNISRIDGNGETTASDIFQTELKGGNYNNNTNIGKVVGGASYTNLVDYGSSNYTGDVDITFEINLESGLVTSVITQPSSISMQYTLSASEITWIKSTLKFIDFAFTTYATGINNYIKTAHIKIE